MTQRPRRWREVLYQDWHRYYNESRSVKATLNALFFDAGFLAVFLLRLSQALEERKHFLLAKAVRRFNLIASSAELNPRAEVGPGLYLPHPYGVGIGRGCKLEENVTVHQGVSLGAKTVEAEGETRRTEYPVVEEGAILYPHVLAFGAVRIGAGAIVLGNSVVVRDVPPGRTYGGIPAQEIRSGRGFTAQDLRGTVQPRSSTTKPENEGD